MAYRWAAMALDPARTLAELHELQALTSDEGGAQRVCWTDDLVACPRTGTRERLAELPVEVETDEAGNLWATLRGALRARAADRRPHRLGARTAAGSTAASNVLAGLEVLRRIAARGHAAGDGAARRLGRRGGRALRPQPVRVERRLRGNLDPDEPARPRDATASRCPTRSPRTASTSSGRGEPARSSKNAAAYLELHIEQGPVLEGLGLPLGVVLGTYGVERHAITLHRPGARTPARRRWTRAATRCRALRGSRLDDRATSPEATAASRTVGTRRDASPAS